MQGWQPPGGEGPAGRAGGLAWLGKRRARLLRSLGLPGVLCADGVRGWAGRPCLPAAVAWHKWTDGQMYIGRGIAASSGARARVG